MKILGAIIHVIVVAVAVYLLGLAAIWAWVDGMGWFTLALIGGVVLWLLTARHEAKQPGTVLVAPHE